MGREVWLKIGGPKMLIIGRDSDGKIKVAWWDKNISLKEKSFSQEALTRKDPGNLDFDITKLTKKELATLSDILNKARINEGIRNRKNKSKND